MKKLIVMTALALFGAQFAKAQFSKGNVLLGGNVNVTTTSQKYDISSNKETSTSFGISPKAGLALNQHWMVGIFVGDQFSFDKTTKDGKSVKTNSFFIMPGVFARNYHMIGNTSFAFYAEANAGYGFGQKKVDSEKTNKLQGFEANVLPGISYFVTKKLVLEAAFGGIRYTHLTDKYEASGEKQKTSEFSFDFLRQLQLGVNFIF